MAAGLGPGAAPPARGLRAGAPASDHMKRPRLAIVGGGTAGWLAALILQKAAEGKRLDLDICVVESSKVPSIGVGEGTTAVFRGLLLSLGLDEFEFLRETEATIKYGIRHKDWRSVGVTYDGPIDDPHLAIPPPEGANGSWLNQYCVASGRPVSEPHLFTYLMSQSRAPFLLEGRDEPLPVGPFHHAYHFDQALVGRYLRSKASGIERIDALVTGVVKDGESGDITALKLDGADDLPVDFVIDCTGFRRALIAGEMGAHWVSFRSELPLNRAMPFWLEHEPEGEIAPYTLAWAREAGWMWAIPTRSRMGCGYVYSDAHTSPEQAQTEIEKALGRPIEPRADIRIDSGRLDRAWIGNCLATGLSQSFFEPLEATNIHGTIVQMLLFAKSYLKPALAGDARAREAYNKIAARQVDDFRAFINLHYVSERRDTAFWRDVAETCIGEATRERLATWSHHMPRRSDFEPFPDGLAHIEEQLYYPVLDGLGLLDRKLASDEMAAVPSVRAAARKTNEMLKKEFRRAAGKAPGHLAFLNHLAEEAPLHV